MKKLIYTAIFGDCDNLKEPKVVSPGWTYICFTDNPKLTSNVWQIELENTGDPKKRSRYYKTHPPTGYDLTVWIDATFTIKKHLDPFALSKSKGIWLNSHPQRQCAYIEAEIVKEKGLDSPEIIDQQIDRYRSEGFPEQWGLWRCGIIVQDPHDPLVKKLNEVWWEEIKNGSWRDQASFAYAAWKTGVTPNNILHGITNIYLRQSLHTAKPTDQWLYDSCEPVEKENPLIQRYDTAHLIITTDRLLFPKWLKNYINPRVGRERMIELVQILGGILVRA